MAGVMNAVAVEQRGAEERQRDEHGPVAGQQGEQGEDAALAAVVRPHDEGEVLDAHHEHE